MRLLTIFSESHQPLFDEHFIKSFPFSEGVDLVARKMPQVCRTGNLFAHGWRDSMIKKEEFIVETLPKFDGEICVFADVDIRFYKSLREDLELNLENQDICFQKDHNDNGENSRCGGFFALRSTEKIRSAFSQILDRLKSYKDENVGFNSSEQHTINTIFRSRSDIKCKMLPSRYYTHGLYNHGMKHPDSPYALWWEKKTPEEKRGIFIPENLKIHHANWCVGVKAKMELLNFVHEQNAKRSNMFFEAG